MNKTKVITVKGAEISVIKEDGQDYICLTDMVKKMDGEQLIKNWLKNKNTIEFLGVWERLNNPIFNLVEFDHIRIEAGRNSYLLSATQWVNKTSAIGIRAKAGRYGGTYAHKDIAFHFGLWLSPEFQLLLIKEFQRLKDEEQKRLQSEWDYPRFLAKVNYPIHTDAVKKYVLPKMNVSKENEWLVYAEEADLLNVALFGCTAAMWREANPEVANQKLNIRDVADAHELIVLSNLESLNAIMNERGMSKGARLKELARVAESQLRSLRASHYTLEKIVSPFSKKNTTNTHPAFDAGIDAILSVPKPDKRK